MVKTIQVNKSEECPFRWVELAHSDFDEDVEWCKIREDDSICHANAQELPDFCPLKKYDAVKIFNGE